MAPRTELERVAIRKLRYMLGRAGNGKKEDGKGDPEPSEDKGGGGGIVV
tara:strand:- start:2121 stop:2267 length:147 start_codon:yes stop_codon:yes gene_type:complete